MLSRISGLPSSRFDFNPQRMLLDLGHQQDLTLLLFGDLKGVGARDPLPCVCKVKASASSVDL